MAEMDAAVALHVFIYECVMVCVCCVGASECMSAVTLFIMVTYFLIRLNAEDYRDLPSPTESSSSSFATALSREEEEGSETEDIKVVERRLFAAQLKSKSQQPWCNQVQQRNIRNAANAGQEPSQLKQFQASDKEPETTDTLRIAAVENELATTHGNSIQQPKTQKTERLPEGEEEEGETPFSEQTMIKSKCVAENTTLEEHGSLDYDFDVGFSACSCKENGDKKQRSRSAEDEEQLQSRTVPSPQDNKANNQSQKGKEIISEEEGGEEENYLIVPEEILESSFVKTKKKHLSCDDAAQEDKCADVSSLFALSESVENSSKKRRKKRKNSEKVNNSPNPVENTNNEPFVNTQKKADEDQISEIVMKRKKKKRRKRESCSENKSEQSSAQGDDSVSVQEGKGTSSFLGADAASLQTVEAPVTGAQKPGADAPGLEKKSAENDRNMEEFNDGVRKKKKKDKKRKVLEMHDGVEKDQEQYSEEANTYQSALSEGDRPEVKKRRKHKVNEWMTPVESLEGTVDAGLPLNHETMVLKKKKKKKKKRKDETCHVIQQSPTAATEGIVLFNVTSSNKPVNSEPEDNKKEKKKRGRMQTAGENEIPRSPPLSKSELTSSDRTKKNKHLKIKRSLHNPNDDFLSDF